MLRDKLVAILLLFQNKPWQVRNKKNKSYVFLAKAWYGMEDDFSIFHAGNFFSFHTPFHTKILVEASHANAYAQAIACFSYIWFKYDILSLQCCKLGGLVVHAPSPRSSAPGFESQIGCANVRQYRYAET